MHLITHMLILEQLFNCLQGHFRGGEQAFSNPQTPHFVGKASAGYPLLTANSRTAVFLRAARISPQGLHPLPAQHEQPATGTAGCSKAVTVGNVNPQAPDSKQPEEPTNSVDAVAAILPAMVHSGTTATTLPTGPSQADSPASGDVRARTKPTYRVNLVKVRHLRAASGLDFGTSPEGFPQRRIQSTNLLELDPDMPLIDVSPLQQVLRGK